MAKKNIDTDLSIAEFCERYRACREGAEWAKNNCSTMHEVWQKAKLSWLVWLLEQPCVATAEDLVRFGFFCIERHKPADTNKSVRRLLEALSGFRAGTVAEVELNRIRCQPDVYRGPKNEFYAPRHNRRIALNTLALMV